MKNNKKKNQNKKQFTKEQFMKFLSTIFAIFALMFVFSAIHAEAQDCTDPAGMPIECPGNQTTDDSGAPCEDTDEDGVCDSDEPEGCVGQASADGQGCENGNDPTIVDPSLEMLVLDLKESLHELIESGHELSDSLRLVLENLDRWNRNVNECDFTPRSQDREIFVRTTIRELVVYTEANCQDSDTADGDFNGDGTVDTTDFIVWHINPSATDDSFFMLEYRVPGTERLIAILFESEPLEPRARKIFIGELSLIDHEIDGEPED